MAYHKPVLLKQVIENLNIKKNGIYIDCTLGGGGHFENIIEKASEVTLIGIDMDDSSIEHNALKLREKGFLEKEQVQDIRLFVMDKCKVFLVKDNFKHIVKIVNIISKLLEEKLFVDGLLLDLGVSSRQLDSINRGFSYIREAPLDMRMDKSNLVEASMLINAMYKKDLIKVLTDFGEEPRANEIANAIIRRRNIKPLITSKDLVEVVESVVGEKSKNACKRVFQAFRIAVNKEFESLEIILNDLNQILNKDGVVEIITFHSLEKKIVETVLGGNKDFRKINEVKPDDIEIKKNNRSRSSILLIYERNK